VKFICFHIGNLCIAVSLAGCGPFFMEDDANFKKRMRELVDDGYIVFDKLGRWRVTEKGLACLLACADRQAKITASQERTPSNE
jgi:hypothetical protein